MKFIIHNIKIWFSEKVAPRVLNFEENKVNVITGDSGTGKSTILAIIDYCMLSSETNIVQDVISDTARWYSIEVTLNSKRYFIARKKAKKGLADSSICLYESNIYNSYPEKNYNLVDARKIINQEYSSKFQDISDGVSYRDVLIFSYLTQSLLISDSSYFAFRYLDIDSSLFKVFHFFSNTHSEKRILNEERAKLMSISERYTKWQEDRIKQEQKYNDKAKAVVSKAVKGKILAEDVFNLSINDQLVELRKILASYTSAARKDKQANRLPEFRAERSRLRLKLRALNRAEKEYNEYIQNVDKIKDSLRPIEIIEDSSERVVRSYETKLLISALALSLSQFKANLDSSVKIPLIDTSEKDELERQIKKYESRVKAIEGLNASLPIDKRYAFSLASRLRASLPRAKYKSSAEPEKPSPDFLEKIAILDERIKDLDTEVEELKDKINESLQYYFDKLKYMGNYTNNKISLESTSNIIQLTRENDAYPHRIIGSQSNEMFLHLCCFLGLHNFSYKLKDRILLPFMFIDQPSMPYYSGSADLNSDDKNKLLDAFKLLDSFIEQINSEYKSSFQIILIEHAPPAYWNGEVPDDPNCQKLSNFHTVEVFTGDNKLIPKEQYNEQ